MLIKLGGRLNSQWYQIGTGLGVPQLFLEEMKGHHEAECMIEVADYWLRNHRDQPTWKELADVVEDIQDYELARSINAVYYTTGMR